MFGGVRNVESMRTVVVVEPEHNCVACLLCEVVCPVDAVHVVTYGRSDDTLGALLL